MLQFDEQLDKFLVDFEAIRTRAQRFLDRIDLLHQCRHVERHEADVLRARIAQLEDEIDAAPTPARRASCEVRCPRTRCSPRT